VLVYGDQQRIEKPEAVRRSICMLLEEAETIGPGLKRHALLVRAFIRLGELAQGIADAEFGALGTDTRTQRQDAAAGLLTMLAAAIDVSWSSRFQAGPPSMGSLAGRLAQLDIQGPVRVKHAEGFAHYALYPETYLEAARRSRLGPDTRVIGIRSIGLSLAALVAAALGAAPPISVRPVGHPFQRTITAAPQLAAELARHVADFAVVDEGPGLSGSSFAAVAVWLEGIGASPDRIHFFPSHANGPGVEAHPSIRRRWARTAQHHVGCEKSDAKGCAILERIEDGLGALVGPLDGPVEDISGGEWRRLRYADEERWPSCDPRMERRKFLARSRGRNWLVKFAGLDESGQLKLERARALARAGLSPEPAGFCYGFIVEEWVDGVPLDRALVNRGALLARLGDYLGFRAREFALPTCSGASLHELAEMACCNTREALGEASAAALADHLAPALDLQARITPLYTDNRLQRWEWLATTDGRLIKTDALDHSSGHDLVGCQDIAWDVAGATAEFSLSRTEVETLCGHIGDIAGRAVSQSLLAILIPCYLAFQLGLWSMAAQSAHPAEARRQEIRAGICEALLSRWIGRANASRPSLAC
jgi:hypothetical protein